MKTQRIPCTIKKRSEFVRICELGSWAKTYLISVACYSLGKDLSVGYTASKKIGKAVKRNKAKRRLRSLVREMAGELEAGCSFVFVANSNTVSCKFSALKSDFLYCIKKSMKRAKRNENC